MPASAARPGVGETASLPGRESFEDRIEISDDLFLAANHLAVTTIESPNSATRSDVDVMNAFSFQFARAPDVVDVVGISAVDNDVACS